MIRRVLIGAVIVGGLLALVVYSQFRPSPDRVSGFLEADEIRVGSRVGGRVRAVHVEEGQRVKEGDILVELEPYDLIGKEQEAIKMLAVHDAEVRRLLAGMRPEEIAQTKARYEQFKARFDLLQAGPRPQEIEAARGRLRVAEGALKLAKQNHDRVSQLVQDNAVSQADFDKASEQFIAASAMLKVRHEELAILELGTREEERREAQARADEAEQAWKLAANGYRQEEIEKAEAARDAALAALDVFQEQKKELTICSPVNGMIEALELQKGDLVPAGAPVLSVMDDRRLWVRTYIPQNRMGLRVGQELFVDVSSFPQERLRGEVTFISREAEFTPTNAQTPEERSKQVFRIKVQLRDPPQKLRAGMTVDVWLSDT